MIILIELVTIKLEFILKQVKEINNMLVTNYELKEMYYIISILNIYVTFNIHLPFIGKSVPDPNTNIFNQVFNNMQVFNKMHLFDKY